MSVASHLNIRIDEYDARIRTFIPRYDEMIDALVHCVTALCGPSPRIVDLGTGTGAVATRCLDVLPGARIIGVERDSEILEIARHRLSDATDRVTFVQGSFLDLALPDADAVVASLALHHVHSRERKQQLYADIGNALKADGVFVSGDCFPSTDPALARHERRAWHNHLRASYSEEETARFFEAWSQEDRYFPLQDELAMLAAAGFAPDVAWRVGPMGVIAARRRPLARARPRRAFVPARRDPENSHARGR